LVSIIGDAPSRLARSRFAEQAVESAAGVDRGGGYPYRCKHRAARAVLCVHSRLRVEAGTHRRQELGQWLEELMALDRWIGAP
jgi:hypothetical protein